MAIVQTKDSVVVASAESASAFAAKHGPGSITPSSGIFRCAGCGAEIAANKGDPMPPQNHHQHPLGVGGRAAPIEWQLLVYAQGKA